MYLRLVCFAIALNIVPILLAGDADWPEFRGPAGDGRADHAKLPVAIDQSVVRWQTPIHGKGWSSPVVWGDQIWLTTATEDGKQMSVLCIDRTNGKIIHDVVVIENAVPEFCHPMNSYATPTPATGGELWKRCRRRLLLTTKTELNAIAPAASIGFSRPAAAAGISKIL